MERSFIEEYKRKILKKDLEEKIAKIRKDKKIVSINGAFDLLHMGHMEILYRAKCLGDILIVALNSDCSIKKYKGKDRPVYSLEKRMYMVAALEFVDFVTFFEEKTPCRILEKIRPDIHVNGSEYTEECIESKVVKKYGGKIHLIDRMFSLSSSKIIKKIKDEIFM